MSSTSLIIPAQKLDAGEVHLWYLSCCELPEADSHYQKSAAEFLSQEELAKLNRFASAPKRSEYLITRVFVRSLLALYANIPPAALEFKHGEFGRPELSVPQLEPPLRFSLSHCDGFIVCAICLRHEIGVDAETIKPADDLLDIARTQFEPEEASALESLSSNQRTERFFQLWTLREAYGKAHGAGLGSRPDGYFSVVHGQPKLVQASNKKSAGKSDERPQLWLLNPKLQVQAALAILGSAQSLKMSEFHVELNSSLKLIAASLNPASPS